MNEVEQGFADLAGVEEAPMINTDVAPEPTAQDGATTEPIAQEQQPELQQQPQFDPSQINQAMATQSAQIQQIAEQMSTLNQNIPKPAPQELSEEQMVQQKIRDDLGITQMEQLAKQQQDMIAQQKQMMEQMQQQESLRQRETQFKALESEYGNIDRQAIQNHLVELNRTNPQLADALNSPEGVRMLASQGVGAVVKQPDAITPSASGADLSTSDASDRILGGNGTEDDFGDMLASYVS